MGKIKSDMPARPARTIDADSDNRGDRTRKAIKQVIAKLAMKKDVADINLSDICAGANLTTGALYFHFKGKDEAIEDMVVDEVTTLYAGLIQLQADDFASLVAAVLTASSRYHRTHKRLPRAIELVINSRPRAYAAWIAGRLPLIERFRQMIAAERLAHGLDADAAPYLAHFILNSMEDLAMDVFQWNNPTLAPFAATLEGWNARQTALWRHAILAPFPA